MRKNRQDGIFVSIAEEFLRKGLGEITLLGIGLRERNRPRGNLANFLRI